MKKYLLVLFGNFQTEETCKEIALAITPLVDSPNLKFQSTHGSIIFHFQSEVSQEEIHDYVYGTLIDLVNSFILTEYNDKVSVFMPKDIKEHLFDLENDNSEVSIRIDLNKKTNLDDLMDEEDFVALLLNEVKAKVTKPTMDQLLDKILLKGIDSLSEFEKETLESYSKN